jgi:hypothetical protein
MLNDFRFTVSIPVPSRVGCALSLYCVPRVHSTVRFSMLEYGRRNGENIPGNRALPHIPFDPILHFSRLHCPSIYHFLPDCAQGLEPWFLFCNVQTRSYDIIRNRKCCRTSLILKLRNCCSLSHLSSPSGFRISAQLSKISEVMFPSNNSWNTRQE